MKLESITVKNYRQFENIKLTFNSDVTILAGANNSGKTSLIALVKNVFTSEKNNYALSDIPAQNMKSWITCVYPIFYNFFENEVSIEVIEKELVNILFPKDFGPSLLINTTSIKIHVSYDSNDDDIKLFADYIMDLDDEKSDFYFLYKYEINRTRFTRLMMDNYTKLKNRVDAIKVDKSQCAATQSENLEKRILNKERYLKNLLVSIYVQSINPIVYFCDEEYKNKCEFEDVNTFHKLFNLCFIKASRPLDDDESDHSRMLSKQMIKMVKLDDNWNELIKQLPDELLIPIQEKGIDNIIRDTSLVSLSETIHALEQTNGGKSGELMLDMQVTEEDISDLLQRITSAIYNVDGYSLGESSQGLGYSNLIYIHLQLKEYERNIDPLKVNMFFLEEPESHMHPQMQHVFIKYLINQYQLKTQGLVTTHSNEIVRAAGISHLRILRRSEYYSSNLYDLSLLLDELKQSEVSNDTILVDFFDWFFEIGYSEIVFADKVIFYEGDTERLFLKKIMTLDKYKELSQQYIAFIQVGGAYAKNYEKLIKMLGIKSLIITDIDYEKDKVTVPEIKDSKITNATIKYFYSKEHDSVEHTVSNIYEWKNGGGNIFDDLIFICFQTDADGYARTLEEAMLNKYFSIDVSYSLTKGDWLNKKRDSKLRFSIPQKKDNTPVYEETFLTVRDILLSTSGSKVDFMYSVILNNHVECMIPDYIAGGLEWLMK